jgi:hypothetical protein
MSLARGGLEVEIGSVCQSPGLALTNVLLGLGVAMLIAEAARTLRVALIPALVAMALLGSGHAWAQEGKYPDPLLVTPGTPEVFQKGLEADGYSLGIQSYTWGYPLVRMERVIRDYVDVPNPKPSTSYRAPLNQIGWARQLATPDAKDMPTANNETLYMSAVVKLDEPFVVTVPDTGGRYYVVNVFNMWQELEHYVGYRTTGTKAGKFVLVPPGWKGSVPADATRLDVKTDKVWLWGRLFVADGESLDAVHQLQDKFVLAPVSGGAKNAKLEPLPEIGNDPMGFFSHLAFSLKSNAVPTADEALFAQFARIGLTRDGFDSSRISEPTRKGLLRGLADAPAVVVSSMVSIAENRQGWTWATGLDSFGFNYPLRSLVAGPYLGGNGEREAMYATRYTDSENAPLIGTNSYVIRFKKAPPVGAFWSVTIYNAEDKMLVKNDMNRFKVGGDTRGLKVRDDGSYEVPIQNAKPAGDFAANWLPAPKGGFYVILRLYIPSDAILSGEYQLPQLERIN